MFTGHLQYVLTRQDGAAKGRVVFGDGCRALDDGIGDGASVRCILVVEREEEPGALVQAETVVVDEVGARLDGAPVEGRLGRGCSRQS